MRLSARRRILNFVLLFGVALLLIVLSFVDRLLSVRLMGDAFVILCIVGGTVLALLIANGNKQEDRPTEHTSASASGLESRRSVWILRSLIVLSVGLLGYGLWDSSGAPVFPRICGFTAGSCMTVAFVIALKKEKAKLGR